MCTQPTGLNTTGINKLSTNQNRENVNKRQNERTTCGIDTVGTST